MTACSLPALLLLVTIDRLTQAGPVPPNHRFTVYAPDWAPQARSILPGDDKPWVDSLPYGRAPSKRTKNIYKTGWMAGGMPFSVLYMNPKAPISERSPMAESLRAFPRAEAQLREAVLVDSVLPDAQALSARVNNPIPTIIPTRKQYSIIPQLFVSYGWGPTGKRE